MMYNNHRIEMCGRTGEQARTMERLTVRMPSIAAVLKRLAFALPLALIGASAPTAIANCTVSALQAAAPADTTIVSAQRLVEPVPHCRTEGYVTTTDPGP